MPIYCFTYLYSILLFICILYIHFCEIIYYLFSILIKFQFNMNTNTLHIKLLYLNLL